MKDNVYEDAYLRERISKIIEAQKQGKYVLSMYREQAGIPRVEDLGLVRSHNMRGTHDFDLSGVGWIDSDYATGQYVFILKEGEKLPKLLENYKTIQLCEAVLDESGRICTINTDKELVTFTAVEVWEDSYTLLGKINNALQAANAGVVVWRIARTPGEGNPSKLPTMVPSVTNNETRLSVTGYAYSEQTSVLVYLGVVGYKTSINSITATMWQAKGLSLFNKGMSPIWLLPDGKYDRTIAPMPEYDAHHCLILNHKAVPGKWLPEDDRVYILSFIGSPSVKDQLVSRLNESLNIPILPEWADRIIAEGYTKKYIVDLTTGGDCISGISIDVKNADWSALVADLLLIQELTI